MQHMLPRYGVIITPRTLDLLFLVERGVEYSAAFLWVAEGVAIMSYVSEDKKAMYIAIFWNIQMGAVIGSCIPFAQNWKNTTSTVSDGTYMGCWCSCC